MQNRNIHTVWQPLLLAAILVAGMFLGYKLSRQQGTLRNFSGSRTRLEDIISLINRYYVDSMSDSALYRNAVEGILRKLDPHTVYIPADELDRVNEDLGGSFYGIGIEFFMARDTAYVSAIIPNGPASRSELQPGDQILKIDQHPVAGKSLESDDIINQMRGKENTPVELQIRPLNSAIKTITLTREEIPVHSIPASFMLDGETGFIVITNFSDRTLDEFRSALQKLVKQGMKSLILDLRDNPGGYLDAATGIADELIGGHQLLVSTRGKNKADSVFSERDGIFEKGPLVVLLNENSASSSEILSGCIQDLDRGYLVGRRSFGKGLVQEQVELPDHAAIRITIARYYLPSGRCIQKSYANGKSEYADDLIERFSHGELQKEPDDSSGGTIFYTKNKRRVKEGKGITPDFFIPLDTVYHASLDSFYTLHIPELFTFHFRRHHPEIKGNPFSGELEPKDLNRWTYFNELQAFFNANHLLPSLWSFPVERSEIKKNLRLHFARLYDGTEGWYRELYRNDAFIEKSLDLIRKHKIIPTLWH